MACIGLAYFRTKLWNKVSNTLEKVFDTNQGLVVITSDLIKGMDTKIDKS